MNNCTICSEIHCEYDSLFPSEYLTLIKKNKSQLYHTKNFIVIPSIGALNKSHVLIVPKFHFLSFASLPCEWDNELVDLKMKLKIYNLNNAGKNLIFFEHGTGSKNNNAGSCVEHAHIHVAWDTDGFEKELLEIIGMTRVQQYDRFKAKSDLENGYVFFENKDNCYWYSNNPDVPSQFFRFLYSKFYRESIDWDWKVSQRTDIVKKCLQYYCNL